MKRYTVYTTSACPKCRKLKSYLKSVAIDYIEADMTSPAALTELRVNGVFTMMAPVLQVGDRFLMVDDMFDGDRIMKAVIVDIGGDKYE